MGAVRPPPSWRRRQRDGPPDPCKTSSTRRAHASLLLPLQARVLRATLTWFAKVWLRHARIVAHLRRAQYDAVVDGGAGVGEFAALVRLALPAGTAALCVEPHPVSAATLRRRGFEVVEAALWNAEGDVLLTQPEAAADILYGRRKPHQRPPDMARAGPCGSTSSGSTVDACS